MNHHDKDWDTDVSADLRYYRNVKEYYEPYDWRRPVSASEAEDIERENARSTRLVHEDELLPGYNVKEFKQIRRTTDPQYQASLQRGKEAILQHPTTIIDPYALVALGRHVAITLAKVTDLVLPIKAWRLAGGHPDLNSHHADIAIEWLFENGQKFGKSYRLDALRLFVLQEERQGESFIVHEALYICRSYAETTVRKAYQNIKL